MAPGDRGKKNRTVGKYKFMPKGLFVSFQFWWNTCSEPPGYTAVEVYTHCACSDQ